MNDQDLHAIYQEGHATDHMTGLRAVWAAAQAAFIAALHPSATEAPPISTPTFEAPPPAAGAPPVVTLK